MSSFIASVIAWVALWSTPVKAQEPAPYYYAGDPGKKLLPMWEKVKRCTGEKIQKGGDYKDIKWFVVSPGGMRKPFGGELVLGRWIAPDTIMVDSLWMGASWVIEHEMVHHIRRGRRDSSQVFDSAHPVKPFRIPCMLMVDQNLPGIFAEDLEMLLARWRQFSQSKPE